MFRKVRTFLHDFKFILFEAAFVIFMVIELWRFPRFVAQL